MRQRWLRNEHRELAKRHLKFNLPRLIEKAISVANGAQYCMILSHTCISSLNLQIGIQILKCIEGLHNKAFILTMDNGAEVFAKLPNPNAGSAHYTTASEVATRQMVCVNISQRDYN